MARSYDEVAVGDELPPLTVAVTRLDLVRYCGASGDFNTIHWNQRAALSVGLPDVIAHGMFTMACAGRLLTDWAGDPGAVLAYSVRFSRPVVVPDDDVGIILTVTGTVEDKPGDQRAVVALRAAVGEDRVLTAARATVQLS